MRVIVVRCLCALLGGLLVSWSIFLFESQERAIQQTLEAWWVRLDDIHQSSTARLILRRIYFQRRLKLGSLLSLVLSLSLQAAAASFCLSLSSFLAMSIVGLWPKGAMSSLTLTVVAGLAVGSFVVAVTERLAYSRYFLTTLILLAIAVMAGLTDHIPVNATKVRVGRMLALAFTVGMLSDFGVVVLVRYLARRGAKTRSPASAIVGAIGSSFMTVAIFIYPVFIMRSPPGEPAWAFALALFGLTNLYSAIIAASFVILSVSVVSHHLAWPVIERPLYAMQRFRIFEQRKALFLAGATLLGIASPVIFDLIEAARRLFV